MAEKQSFDRYVVLDFETTGLNRGYKPVEIAWLEFDRDFAVIERVDSLINPNMAIEEGATKVHGITSAMVADSPTLDKFVVGTHSDKFRDGRTLIVAHNAKFDLPMISRYCGDATALCTMMLSFVLMPEAKNHQLGTLTELCGVQVAPTHRALADVEACFLLLQHFATNWSLTLERMIELTGSFNGDSVMPFGRYQGTTIKELPSDYVDWMFGKFESDHWVVQILKNL